MPKENFSPERLEKLRDFKGRPFTPDQIEILGKGIKEVIEKMKSDPENTQTTNILPPKKIRR